MKIKTLPRREPGYPAPRSGVPSTEEIPQVSNSNSCMVDQCSYKYLFLPLSAGSANDVGGREIEPAGVQKGTRAHVCCFQ